MNVHLEAGLKRHNFTKRVLMMANLNKPPHYASGSQHKIPKKCRLKDCVKLTVHNGGFCCAEHHKKYYDK